MIFTASVIIAATILVSVLILSNTQIALAEQKGGGGGDSKIPPPDCSIHTMDGRIIFVPCPPPSPPVVDTTMTKSPLLNNDEIGDASLQASPSSSITANSIQGTDDGNAKTERPGNTESMNTQSIVEQNDADEKAIQSDDPESASESSDEENSNDSESSNSDH